MNIIKFLGQDFESRHYDPQHTHVSYYLTKDCEKNFEGMFLAFVKTEPKFLRKNEKPWRLETSAFEEEYKTLYADNLEDLESQAKELLRIILNKMNVVQRELNVLIGES